MFFPKLFAGSFGPDEVPVAASPPPPPPPLWEPTSLQTEGGQASYLGFIMVFEEASGSRRNNYQTARQYELHNEHGDVRRLHLLNKQLQRSCFLGGRIQGEFYSVSFIIFLAFLPEPFYHLQHKKLDKTRNFSAGSRAVRFCVRGNASQRLPVRVGYRVESARGPSVGARNTFAAEPLQRRP